MFQEMIHMGIVRMEGNIKTFIEQVCARELHSIDVE